MTPQRLPTPGSDTGTWGAMLNGFLRVSHEEDGRLKPSALTQAGAVRSDVVTQIVVLSQSEYDQVANPSSSTLYVIV
jgi:hypothetical protein